MSVDQGIHATAARRRRIVAKALSHHLDVGAAGSTAQRFRALLDQPRSLLVNADIDGLLSAAMLASVAPRWRIAAFTDNVTLIAPPSMTAIPEDTFGVDLFSPNFDNVSNHVVLYGRKKVVSLPLREALGQWDKTVMRAWGSRTFVVPSLWVGSEAGYEDAGREYSAKYKYPFGSAQITLAMLEAVGRPPKFFDRTFLPWLVANADGGATSLQEFAYNTTVWWSSMAAVVGQASITERIYQRVDDMRPLDLRAAINGLSRERAAEGKRQVLKDNWKLTGQSILHLQEAIRWLCDLTVWPDPVRGGVESMTTWVPSAPKASGLVYIENPPPSRKNPPKVPTVNAKADPARASSMLKVAAAGALNANFATGGVTGSRFNWISGW